MIVQFSCIPELIQPSTETTSVLIKFLKFYIIINQSFYYLWRFNSISYYGYIHLKTITVVR
jgi:hypothetical protein